MEVSVASLNLLAFGTDTSFVKLTKYIKHEIWEFGFYGVEIIVIDSNI